MTDQPRNISIIRGPEQRYAQERHSDDEPYTGDFGLCPFCREPLGNLPTETHPYFGIEMDLDTQQKHPAATCVYECLNERKEP